MPKYFCEYCGTYLTRSSPGGRNQHVHGRKHINNKIEYYSQFLYEFQKTINDNLLKITSKLMKKTQENNNNNHTKNKSTLGNENQNTPNQLSKATFKTPGELPVTIHFPPHLFGAGEGENNISNYSDNLLQGMKIPLPLQLREQMGLSNNNSNINEEILKNMNLNNFSNINMVASGNENMNFNLEEDDKDNKDYKDDNINDYNKIKEFLDKEREKQEREAKEKSQQQQQQIKKNKHHGTKNILENLKKMRYCYNDPNPETNPGLIQDLLHEDDDDDEDEEERNNKYRK